MVNLQRAIFVTEYLFDRHVMRIYHQLWDFAEIKQFINQLTLLLMFSSLFTKQLDCLFTYLYAERNAHNSLRVCGKITTKFDVINNTVFTSSVFLRLIHTLIGIKVAETKWLANELLK